MKKPPSAGRLVVESPPASSPTPSSPLAFSRPGGGAGALGGVAPYERLITLLSRYGSASMARIAVQQATTTIYGSRAGATGAQLERVIEEAMSVFRVFCDESKRAQLWIDLVEFCESERRRTGP